MIKNCYNEITSFTALEIAESEVAKGRKNRNDTLRFDYNREANLHQLSDELRAGQIPQINYGSFQVFVPKVRTVVFIDYPNKIIQRALYDYLNPRLVRSFISDTYACIPGRGQSAAINRIQSWLDSMYRSGEEWYGYKYDVRHYFYRIVHKTLIELLEKKIADSRTLELLEYYINDPKQPDVISDPIGNKDIGVAIGGGLSHMLGNLYLDPLDQFIKRELGYKYYIRYMDDGLIFSRDRAKLKQDIVKIEQFLQHTLSASFNDKAMLFPIKNGVEFVGYRFKNGDQTLRKSTTLHAKRRLSKLEKDYNNYIISLEQAKQTISSYQALIDHTDMDKFKSKLFWNLCLTHGNLEEAKSKGNEYYYDK